MSVTFWFIALSGLLLLAVEPSLDALPPLDRVTAAFFQVISASTTVGFNTLPIKSLSLASLSILIGLMIFGASSSGTGGGLKSTTFSALFALTKSTLKGRSSVRFFKRTVPEERLHMAMASFSFYMVLIALGTFILLLSEPKFLLVEILFETVSALGTVGLSLGVTSQLSEIGKLVIIALMFIGRLGVLTFGIAITSQDESLEDLSDNDIAV